MKTNQEHPEGFDHLIKNHRIPAPSAALRETVLGSAREAWAEPSPREEQVSWVVPVLRLAACLVLACLLFRAVNAPGEREARYAAFFEQSSEVKFGPGADVASFLSPANTLGLRSSEDVSTLLQERQRLLRQMLEQPADRNSGKETGLNRQIPGPRLS